MMNSGVFFAEVKKSLFSGDITQEQVDGMNALHDVWESFGTNVLEQLAYCYATAYHETGTRMIPVREGQGQRASWSDAQARHAVEMLFNQGRIKRNYALPSANGKSYYGRGPVQLTHEENYAAMGKVLGLDLVNDPDLVLELETGYRVLVEGVTRGVSLKGDFSKYALEDFIYPGRIDYVGARKTVNGSDKAFVVAGYAEKFEAALKKSGWSHGGLKSVQARLAELGYHEVGAPDGVWGSRTSAAVLAFRNDNKLTLKAEVDEEFMEALKNAPQRPIVPERAAATTVEVAKKVEVVQQASFLQSFMKWVGLGGVATGGITKFFEGFDPNVTTQKVGQLKMLYLTLAPMWPFFAVVAVAFIGYYLARRVTKTGVEGFKIGKIF